MINNTTTVNQSRGRPSRYSMEDKVPDPFHELLQGNGVPM